MQSFYNGLSQKSREPLDATAGGSFMSLTARKAKILMKKIAENKNWPSGNIQSCHQSEEHQTNYVHYQPSWTYC
jgi:hypothetical protein